MNWTFAQIVERAELRRDALPGRGDRLGDGRHRLLPRAERLGDHEGPVAAPGRRRGARDRPPRPPREHRIVPRRGLPSVRFGAKPILRSPERSKHVDVGSVCAELHAGRGSRRSRSAGTGWSRALRRSSRARWARRARARRAPPRAVRAARVVRLGVRRSAGCSPCTRARR